MTTRRAFHRTLATRITAALFAGSALVFWWNWTAAFYWTMAAACGCVALGCFVGAWLLRTVERIGEDGE